MLTWPRVVAAAVTAMLLVVISPPVNLHWAHWLSFLPLLWALRDDDDAGNAVLGYLYGYLSLFGLYFWLAETVVRFSNIPLFLSYAIVHIFALVFALPCLLVWGLVHFLRRRLGIAWILLIPAIQVACDWLLPNLFPFTHGDSQYRNPWTWQIVSVTGVYGLTWLILLTNCTFAEFIYRRREGRPMPWVALGVTAGFFLANMAFGIWRFDAVEKLLSDARTIRVSLLQQNVTMEQRLASTGKAALESWFKTTSKILGQEVDLVIWPEGACPYNPHEKPVLPYLQKLVTEGGFEILLGGGTHERSTDPVTGKSKHTWYNSCYLIGRQGEVKGRYDKMVPLPFGEYIPFSDTFPFLKDIIEGPGDFRAGKDPVIFQADGYTFATPICYEAILESTVRRLKAADLFVNVTNDAWFGDTASPHQHAMLSAVRATEFGRPMVRVAYSGISMVAEPHGRILYEKAPFTDAAEVVPVRMGRIETIYSRFGNWFATLCLLAGASGIILARQRGRASG